MKSENRQSVVLITGSSGLIGSRISQRLAPGHTVVGLDIKEPDEPIEGTHWLECDFTDDASVSATLATVSERFGSQLTSVIHLAAYYDFAGEPSPLYNKLTVEGTRRLLKGLQEFDSVEQFIFSSSLLVMKPCEPGQRLTEESPTQAEWEYPQSKLDAEKVIQDEHGDIRALSLRLAGVYDEVGHSIPITQNIRRVAEKEMESYFYPGDAERGQAFVHIDDTVRAFDYAIESRAKLQPYEVLLIAEDECLSYGELQDEIGELVHGVDDWPTVRIPKAVAKAGAWVKEKMATSEEDEPFIKPWMVDLADAHYPVDNSRALERIGWQPRHRLSATLPAIIHRLKRNPRLWYQINKLPLPEDQETLVELATSST